jgi:ubiquinone/menaquinone biosynthesis C-methylase UbiE
MATPTDPRREHPSTYFVQDRENVEEFTRMQIQDHLMTASMGGVLPEQPDPTIFGSVLDVGCATGGWLIEAAKAYPTMRELVGIDINSKVVAYARAQAEAERLSDRMQFRTMDALRMLEFPNGSFDLVNQRAGASYLRKWDWPKLLLEYQRVTRAGGVIRITEGDLIVESSSPALSRLFDLLLQAFYQAGHVFTPESDGVTSQLAHLLTQYGLTEVETRTHRLQYNAGTAEWHRFFEDMRLLFRTIVPFLRKWSQVPNDYEAIYQQALAEMQQPDFVAAAGMLTAWGRKPE